MRSDPDLEWRYCASLDQRLHYPALRILPRMARLTPKRLLQTADLPGGTRGMFHFSPFLLDLLK